MTGCAIVAIPDEYSPVWKVSSEKVPHLTMLYLGELAEDVDQAQLSLFVQHAVSLAEPFGLSVHNRGTLGDDNADVLFFKKDSRPVENLEDLRSFLLSDPQIFKAYSAVHQYPSWTPHLTLGYPTAPAKPVATDYNVLDYVFFDRIAIWFGDFEGPTFELEHKYRDHGPEALMMSDRVGGFLQHFGVKGMKWGVRKDGGAAPVNTNTETVRVTAPKTKTSIIQQKQRSYEKKNADTAVTVVERPGQKLTTKGGSNRTAHDDAVKAAEARRVATSSSTDALSTKDLQALVARMNLEQQYAKLTTPPKSQAEQFLEGLIGTAQQTGNENFKKILNEQASTFLLNKGLRQETDNEISRREKREKAAKEAAK